MTMNEFPQGLILKDSYPFMCSECSHEMFLVPSIIMIMGLNSGHGTCSKCKTFLHLEINADNETAKSEPMNKYHKRLGLVNEN